MLLEAHVEGRSTVRDKSAMAHKRTSAVDLSIVERGGYPLPHKDTDDANNAVDKHCGGSKSNDFLLRDPYHRPFFFGPIKVCHLLAGIITPYSRQAQRLLLRQGLHCGLFLQLQRRVTELLRQRAPVDFPFHYRCLRPL